MNETPMPSGSDDEAPVLIRAVDVGREVAVVVTTVGVDGVATNKKPIPSGCDDAPAVGVGVGVAGGADEM